MLTRIVYNYVSTDNHRSTPYIKTGYQYDNTSPACAFTTENINQFKEFDLVDKKVLAVAAGGGDALLSILLKNAHTVDTFDITMSAKHAAELKCAAILCLSRKEFRDFFNISQDNEYMGGIKFEYYDRLCRNLSHETKTLFDKIRLTPQLIDTVLHRKDRYRLEENIFLQNDDDYKRLQKVASVKPKFIQSSLSELYRFLDSEYDFIYLSNIHQSSAATINMVGDLEKITRFLRPGGIIMANYFYAVPPLDDIIGKLLQPYHNLTDFSVSARMLKTHKSQLDDIRLKLMHQTGVQPMDIQVILTKHSNSLDKDNGYYNH